MKWKVCIHFFISMPVQPIAITRYAGELQINVAIFRILWIFLLLLFFDEIYIGFNSTTIMMLNRHFSFSSNMHLQHWRQKSKELLWALEKTKKNKLDEIALASCYFRLVTCFMVTTSQRSWMFRSQDPYMFINRSWS